MTTDWQSVYREEKRCPGYVIENGRSAVKTQGGDYPRRKAMPPQHNKRKAA